jgi:hypothetical protein
VSTPAGGTGKSAGFASSGSSRHSAAARSFGGEDIVVGEFGEVATVVADAVVSSDCVALGTFALSVVATIVGSGGLDVADSAGLSPQAASAASAKRNRAYRIVRTIQSAGSRSRR